MFKVVAAKRAANAGGSGGSGGSSGSGSSSSSSSSSSAFASSSSSSWLPYYWSAAVPAPEDPSEDDDGWAPYGFRSAAAAAGPYPDNASAGKWCAPPAGEGLVVAIAGEECPLSYRRRPAGRGRSGACHEAPAAAVPLLLSWAKRVAVKAARSYHAFPLALFVLPLALGLAAGFWIGRRGRRDRRSQKQPRSLRDPSRTERREPEGVPTMAGRFVASMAASMWRWCFRTERAPAEQPGVLLREQQQRDRQEDWNRNEDGREESAPESAAAASPQDEEDDEAFRERLRAAGEGCERESGVDLDAVPRHVAIIMDGNRRHGRAAHGDAARGHWDGSRRLVEVARWCQDERVRVLTVYAFSTENWDRDPAEVAALMAIFTTYCEELRREAVERNIRVRVLSTDASRIPAPVRAGLDRLQEDTKGGKGGLQMNICLSYGGRGEIVNACRFLAGEAARGRLDPDRLTERDVRGALLTSQRRHGEGEGDEDCPDPDVLIRTSGEYRLSNFLLWQVAYTELFFVDKNWPEFEKSDLLDVIRAFALGRKRRFGR